MENFLRISRNPNEPTLAKAWHGLLSDRKTFKIGSHPAVERRVLACRFLHLADLNPAQQLVTSQLELVSTKRPLDPGSRVSPPKRRRAATAAAAAVSPHVNTTVLTDADAVDAQFVASGVAMMDVSSGIVIAEPLTRDVGFHVLAQNPVFLDLFINEVHKVRGHDGASSAGKVLDLLIHDALAAKVWRSSQLLSDGRSPIASQLAKKSTFEKAFPLKGLAVFDESRKAHNAKVAWDELQKTEVQVGINLVIADNDAALTLLESKTSKAAIRTSNAIGPDDLFEFDELVVAIGNKITWGVKGAVDQTVHLRNQQRTNLEGWFERKGCPMSNNALHQRALQAMKGRPLVVILCELPESSVDMADRFCWTKRADGGFTFQFTLGLAAAKEVLHPCVQQVLPSQCRAAMEDTKQAADLEAEMHEEDAASAAYINMVLNGFHTDAINAAIREGPCPLPIAPRVRRHARISNIVEHLLSNGCTVATDDEGTFGVRPLLLILFMHTGRLIVVAIDSL